jgi:hypothetical protein
VTLLLVATSDLVYWLVAMVQNFSCVPMNDLPSFKIAIAALVFITLACFICLFVDFAYKTPVFLWPYRLFLVGPLPPPLPLVLVVMCSLFQLARIVAAIGFIGTAFGFIIFASEATVQKKVSTLFGGMCLKWAFPKGNYNM